MKGVHHLGLSVSDLEATRWFFCELLNWKEVKRDPSYPAIYVANDTIMFTLWQCEEGANEFNRRRNVGLHHVALEVDSEQELNDLYEKFQQVDNVAIEFGPTLVRDGPAKRIMCYEPSGNRIEFIWAPPN